MAGEPVGAEQAELLGGVPDEEDRAPGPLGRARQRLGDLEHAHRAAAVVVGAVEDRVGRGRPQPPEAVEHAPRCAPLCRAWACPGVFSAPSGRMTRLKARSESWSSGAGARPMWSLWAPMATIWPRSAGSPAEQEGHDVAGGRGRRRVHEARWSRAPCGRRAGGSVRQRLAQQGVGHARGDVEKRGRGPRVARWRAARPAASRLARSVGDDGVERRHRDAGGGGEPLGGRRAVHRAGRSASADRAPGSDHHQLARRLLGRERRPSAVAQRPAVHRLTPSIARAPLALVARDEVRARPNAWPSTLEPRRRARAGARPAARSGSRCRCRPPARAPAARPRPRVAVAFTFPGVPAFRPSIESSA